MNATVASGVAVSATGIEVDLGGKRVLDSVDLEVGTGELVALLGPSGCGKTTLLRVLAGLQRPNGGRVVMGGKDVTDVPTRRRPIGMVFQQYALFPTMTVLENVEFPLNARRDRTGVSTARARELLAMVGMVDFEQRRPIELSGGQQQRVALARALARAPEVLLLDEPLSALDAVIRDTLRDEIRQLQLRLELAVVHVTHDQNEAMAMADRIAVMSGGKINEIGAPAELYRSPRHVSTARFVGSRNEVDVVEAGGRARWGEALDAPVPAGTVGVLFPPEAVEVTPDSDGAIGEPARVILSSFQGSTIRLHVAVNGTSVVAELPSTESGRFAPGTICRVRIRPDAITPVPASDGQRPSASSSMPSPPLKESS